MGTKSGAYQVKLTLPADLLRDPTAVRKAREDLQKVQQYLFDVEHELIRGEARKEADPQSK